MTTKDSARVDPALPEPRDVEAPSTLDEETVRRRLEEAIRKYGFTPEELGPNWRRLVEIRPASSRPQ